MVTEPADMPVTMPVPGVIAAIAGLLLLHVPPEVALKSVTVLPTHTLDGPVIESISVPELSVMVTCDEQPRRV